MGMRTSTLDVGRICPAALFDERLSAEVDAELRLAAA